MTKRMKNTSASGSKSGRGGSVRLLLSTPANARKTYMRLLKSYASGALKEKKYRALIFGMSGYLSFLRFEHDVRFGERLDALEEKLSAMRKAGGLQ